MTDKKPPEEPEPEVIKLPTPLRHDALTARTLEYKRAKLDAMHERMERGEWSEAEMNLVKIEQAREAFGQRRMPPESLPYDTQPAVREAIEKIWAEKPT